MSPRARFAGDDTAAGDGRRTRVAFPLGGLLAAAADEVPVMLTSHFARR